MRFFKRLFWRKGRKPVPFTELVTVSNQPSQSIFQLASNGLYLPPMPITMQDMASIQKSPYPEFAKEVVQQLSTTLPLQQMQQQQSVYPTWTYQSYSFNDMKWASVPKKLNVGFRPTLRDIVPSISAMVSLPCAPTCFHNATHSKVAIANAIMHLNDNHKWSRERIADWLDTLPIDLTVKKVA